MTTRTVAGVKLTSTPKGWTAPNDRFRFHRMNGGWVVADDRHFDGTELEGTPCHPLMDYGHVWLTLELAVAEAKRLLVLEVS